jgi:hypothetical protein
MTALPLRRGRWWAIALAYYVVCCLMHLQFSLWLVRQRVTFAGPLSYSQAMPALVIAGGIGLLLWLGVRIRRSPRPALTAVFWLLWIAAVASVDRWLTYSINEYAHYPQYALLAWLVARAMDPGRTRWYVGRVLFWATLMGMGDELLQYLWITTSYSEYLDFNDFFTNLIAVAGGVLIYYGTGAGRRSDERRKPAAEIGVALLLALGVAGGLATGRIVHTPASTVPPGGIAQRNDGSHVLVLQRGPDFYGSWQASKRHERYHVIAPEHGLPLLLLVGLLFAGYGCWGSRTSRS